MQEVTHEQLRRMVGKKFIGVGVAFICYDSSGRIFLAKRTSRARDSSGVWDVGAGEVELGQTIEETLHRELLEEYGVEPLTYDFFAYIDNPKKLEDNTYRHWLIMCFLVKVDHAQVKIMETDKFDDSGWFSIDTLPSPLHPQFELFMPLYGKKLKAFLANLV